jgi:diacylglycerol kinase family enzyme
MPSLHVLLNSRSGTATLTSAELRDRFEALGYEVTVDDDHRRPFPARLRNARQSAAEILVAAGGDGTVTALAEVAAETDRPMLVVPFGTANLLARDLALPLDVEDWLTALPDFVERRIDLGRVNGHLFLHKVVIGFVPGIAAAREKIRGVAAIGARLAFIGYAMRRILRARRIALELTRDGQPPHIDRLQAVAIANNHYDEAFGHFFSRATLDGGHLSVYKLQTITPLKAVGLALGVFLGRWQDDAALTIETAETLTIRSRRRRLKVMLDGEVETLMTPLGFTIEKQKLRVLAPPVVAVDDSKTDVEAAA